MSDKHRCLMLGAGGMGSRWIRDIWSPFRERMVFAGLVDVNPSVKRAAGDWLGLPPAARFTDPRAAFATVDAGFCCIVTQPDQHREAVELACSRGMDILSEKPIADILEHCAAIAQAVKTAGSFACYEGNNLATGETNSWHGEYYRVECEGGVAVLDRGHLMRIQERGAAGTLQTREMPPVEVIHQAIAAQFLDWLDGGLPPPTTPADNLQSTAKLVAAGRASETGTTVDV